MPKQNKVVARKRLRAIVSELKKKNKKIVTTNGTFDILHVGHARNLEKAKKHGDILIVGINSDRSVKAYKGDKRPIVPEKERAEMVASLACVDYVTIFDEGTPVELLSIIHPHVHAKGGDWKKETMPEWSVVREGGGKVVRIPLVPGLSTTAIIEKVKSVYGK